jgi:uncharacterized RDD family membrane protein YckC
MNTALPGLAVDSVTGIDVSLPVAGPGARSYAFLIDWHIRLVLALAWYAVAALLYNGRLSLAPPLTNEALWFGGVVAPALAIYFLYHWVLELVMRGSTPGKRMAGVRIVARDGGAPGAGALLARNAFRLIDSLPLLYCVGLVAVVMTREHLRIGDMAAGTLLIYESNEAHLPGAAQRLQGSAHLDPRAAELVAELLERWPTLRVESRQQLAQQLLARYGTESGGTEQASLHERLERLVRSTPGAP